MSHWPWLVMDLGVRATILLTIACLAALLLRRRAAAVRHLVWTCALAGLLVLPALSVFIPQWGTPTASLWAAPAEAPPVVIKKGSTRMGEILAQAKRLPAADPVAVAQAADRQAEDAPADALFLPPVPEALKSVEPPVWPEHLLLVWAAGAFFSLVALAIGIGRLHVLKRACCKLDAGHMYDMATRIAADLGLRRPVRLLTSSERAIPMTWGFVRPTLLMPQEAEQWSQDRLRMVLLHELGHMVRWDSLTHLLGSVARSLYWFHPLAWLALAKQRQMQEEACDDIVVSQGNAAPDYAEHLLAVTAHLPPGYLAPSLALGMARTSRLHRRLAALLDAGRRRGPATRRAVVIGVLASVILLAPAASARWITPPPVPPQPAMFFEVDAPAQPTPEALKRLEEVRKKLKENYVGPLDEKKLLEAAIKGLLESVKDPYTDFLPADEVKNFERQMKGQFVGIGAQLKMNGELLTVVTPLDNSPALKAGLQPGDVIEAIDGQPTRGAELAESIKKILGEKGTVVKLKIVHQDGVVQEIAVTRGPIRVGTVQGLDRRADGSWRHLLDAEHKIGYLHVTQFGPGTAQDVHNVLAGLQKNGLKGLILDLRFCPGGMLNEALGLCKLFVGKGELLTIKGADKKENKMTTDSTPLFGDLSLVVVVNDQTASAGEIVAGILRERGRAIVLGTRTFGKGSVQTVLSLEGGAALKVTTAFYYLPGGKMIHKKPGEKSWGVDPNDGFYVPITKAQQDALMKSQHEHSTLGHAQGEAPKIPERITAKQLQEQYADPQLAAAARTLVAKVTGGEFLKVGHSQALLQDHLLRLEEMRERREALLHNLQQLDKDIDAVQQAVGKKK